MGPPAGRLGPRKPAMPIDTGEPTTGPPPTGRRGGPWATSSSLRKFLPRLARLPFNSVERLACFSFFVLLAFFSRTGGATCVHGQVNAPRLATSARLRARSARRCAVAARSLLAPPLFFVAVRGASSAHRPLDASVITGPCSIPPIQRPTGHFSPQLVLLIVRKSHAGAPFAPVSPHSP